MRLNRKIRIGAALVALALLLLGLVTITRRLQPDAPPTTVAGNTNANTVAEAGNTVAAPASSGRIARARQNIPERSIVTPEMLEFRDARPGEESGGFVTDANAQAVGFVTSRPIAAGREVRQADLLGHISDVGVAGALLPGRRAMILPIGGKSTLHDLVRIGDRVDIVASFEQQEARVVAEDVRVLAVDVFGSDYPPVKIAMRGDYKAPARAVSSANPPSPAGSAAGAGGAPNPDAPAGQQPIAGAPAAGAPAGPEPTPTQGPPPARPEAALTIEVTPQQATDIALTQSAGQNIDFLLRARTEPRVPTPGGPGALGAPGSGGVTLASGESRSATFSTRDRLAPNAARARKPAASPGSGAASAGRAPSRNASSQSSGGASGPIRRGRSRSGGGSDYFPPALPDVPPPSRSIPPANPNAGLPVFGPSTPGAPSRPSKPALSPTYDIPIVAGNKVLRVDTVRRPPANR